MEITARPNGENALIADWLLRLTGNKRNWGFCLCFLYLLNVKRFGWNHNASIANAQSYPAL